VALWAHVAPLVLAVPLGQLVPPELAVPLVLPARPAREEPDPEPIRTPSGLLLLSVLLSLCSYAFPD